MGIRKFIYNLSIQAKVAFLVSAAVITTSLVLVAFSYHFARALISEQIHAGLGSVAQERQYRLLRYLDNQQEKIRLVASRTTPKKLLRKYLDKEIGRKEFVKQTKTNLQHAIKSTPDFKRVWILDTQGQEITSTSDKAIGDSFESECLIRAKENTCVSEPFFDGASYRAYVSGPIIDRQGLLGIIVAELDLEPLVALLRDSGKELGKTGEILVGVQRGDEIEYLLPGRFLKKEITRKITTVPAMKNAVNGVSGFMQTRDYRGEMTLAAYQPVGYRDWGLVAKIDIDEAYAPIDELGKDAIAVTVALLFVVILLTSWLSQKIARRLGELVVMANDITNSNFESRITLRGNDELAVLANTFNRMAETIGEQIQTLSIANESLNKEITERKRIQEQLAELAAIVESSADAIVSENIEGVITNWNKGAAKVYGYEAGEMIGKPVKSVVPEILHGETDEISEQIRLGESVVGLETVRKRKDGREINVSITKSPIRDEGGKVVGIASIVRDISDLKHMQEELEHSKEVSESANQAKSRFLANMSHEIRTPMTAILGFAQMMQSPNLTEEEKENSIQTIVRNGKHLLELINDILDLSKVEAGELKIHREEMFFEDELFPVLSTLEGQAKEKELYLKLEYKSKLPKTITSDPVRFRQVLTNLIGNAMKFTREGGIQVRARLLPPTNGSGALLQFTITDTGCGIPLDSQKDLFKPFSQVFQGSLARRFGGTGLGLALSRRFARALGGGVDLQKSAPGEGSTFIFTLDPGSLDGVEFEEAQTDVPFKPLWKQQVIDEESILKGRKVLLVEDSPDSQKLVLHILRGAGAKVSIADNGLQAEEMALTGNYNVILMDIGLPLMDGYEVTQALRKAGYKRPIVALSAHAMKEERRRCFEAGCNEYLSKPIAFDELINTVSKWSI